MREYLHKLHDIISEGAAISHRDNQYVDGPRLTYGPQTEQNGTQVSTRKQRKSRRWITTAGALECRRSATPDTTARSSL